ncbi:response regulator [Roseomonas sp. GC11]|uniref:hybrid sensor histidine kinase/response regulator n=1 Tax=Roseomonas sp. GC11 TaxID=2950546 RepID=UPI00210BC137|nr:response regulator [Roseomonas sp. GC11]MCQ4161361.1 response regulator [Roseomonas sp. GC11]
MSAAPPALSPGAAALRLLVVDDEPLLGAELAEGLQRALGLPTLHVTSAEEGLRRLRAAPEFGVVVSDIRMPGMDGLSFARQALAERGEAQATEIILVTGHATLEDAATALRLGSFDFLRKPFRLREAVESARAALERAAARRAAAARSARAEEEVAALARRLREALSTKSPPEPRLRVMAHELRTPLVPILGFAEMLESDALPGPARRAEALREIRQGAERLLGAVDMLLALKRLEQSPPPPQRQRVEMNTLAARAVAGCAALAAARGVMLRQEPAPLLWVAAEPALLEPALCAVLRNAVLGAAPEPAAPPAPGSPPAGEVTLSLAETGDEAWLRIEASGPWPAPLAEEEAESSLLRGAQDGQGIALAHAQAVALRHGAGWQVAGGEAGGRFVLPLPRLP